MFLLLFGLPLLAYGLSRPAPGCSHKIKEAIAVPRGWSQGPPAPRDHIIALRVALPQQRFHELEAHLYEISDPLHDRYGQHLTKSEVEELVAPHPESADLVDSWLLSHGIDNSSLKHSPAGDWVTVRVPVSLAEEMLDTTYYSWTHEKSGESIVRTLQYSVPENLHEHIELIQPTTFFTRTRAQRTTYHWAAPVELDSSSSVVSLSNGAQVNSSCNSQVTISCLQELYNAVGYKPHGFKKGNKIGVTGYLGEFANIADLQGFYGEQVPAAVNSSFDIISVNGGQNLQNLSQAGPEADLDVQFAFGLTFPTPGTFWTTGGSPPFITDEHTPTDSNEPYTSWLDVVLSQRNPPQTITTSYGDDEQTVPKSFALRACQGFAQLGARGVSLLFASGDFGVGDGDPNPETQVCITNDGSNKTAFIPVFPSTCPFVTSVGGTTQIKEVAADFSGGGFSNYFPRPSYQNRAVGAFLKQLPENTYAGLFNRNGRGFPDVSAQAENFRIFFQGEPALIDGTSCATPAFAGFVALLNDARLARGQPSLGFLNPFLYSVGLAGLNDITVGNNPGCGTPGFNATRGWDPITGLGTPNFGILKALVS